MRAFLDFEASSLSDDSYPIEVAWVFEDGCSEAHLIRPLPQWEDWDPEAASIHGITRRQLALEGEPVDVVARRLVDQLTGHTLHASAPSWDGKWLSVLLRGGGLPRHALRLTDSDEAHLAAAAEALHGSVADGKLAAAAAAVLAHVRAARKSATVAHRALADAQAELDVWLEVRRIAEAGAEAVRGGPSAD